ncbi:MAG: 23S rRNA (pseudouridine(1915)-N(3))-methyltransferase RlmH [Gammaproteobacteria bacterium]|nr:23S rRNA (pseudouridine(1915)-N(3))-methyltransferase RlmH [Gammaproteobacteria bacterium]
MDIHLISVGTRIPRWVDEGYRHYAKRLTGECQLRLTEIPPVKRGKNADIPRILRQEGALMLEALPKGSRVVALDVGGRTFSTEQLANHLERLLAGGQPIALLVGGPEGLAAECLTRADERWSLSSFTLPHTLVRVVVAEQLYRAWSLLHNHPYHRG